MQHILWSDAIEDAEEVVDAVVARLNCNVTLA
jgi:hypothetical protein